MSEVPELPKEVFRLILWWRCALQMFTYHVGVGDVFPESFHHFTRDLRDQPGMLKETIEDDILQFWIEARYIHTAKRRKIK